MKKIVCMESEKIHYLLGGTLPISKQGDLTSTCQE